MTNAWTSWGATQPELSRGARALLREALGPLTASKPAAVADARLAPSALPDATRQRLVTALGETGVRTDAEGRARHAGGQSYEEIVRRRHGDAGAAPDAVLLPSKADDIDQVLRICTDDGVAVVPWGGGTSVVGGLAAERGPHRALVALDLSRLDQLLSVDEESLTATFQPGITTPAAEAA